VSVCGSVHELKTPVAMKSVITTVFVLALITTVGALIVLAVVKAQHAAKLTHCKNSLKQIGLGLHAYHDSNKRFPSATVPNPTLPPEKRCGWLTEVFPSYMAGGTVTLLDPTKAWDDPINSPPRWRTGLNGDHPRESFVGDHLNGLCPSNPSDGDPKQIGATPYVGVAGLGESSAELPLLDPKAGLFGYERRVALDDLKHGSMTTIAVVETLHGGPWTAGGRATVRGFLSNGLPYFGEGGQFSRHHPAGTNVLFADGSVRVFESSASPRMVDALIALAGDGPNARLDD
jgi:prepilin-type processing-associated H-X9-DG protein